MGMAASQARFLSLTARKSNVEYEGQQINQERTALANESSNIYAQLSKMEVPAPPNTTDFYKTVYTFNSKDISGENKQYTLEELYNTPDGQKATLSWKESYNMVANNSLVHGSAISMINGYDEQTEEEKKKLYGNNWNKAVGKEVIFADGTNLPIYCDKATSYASTIKLLAEENSDFKNYFMSDSTQIYPEKELYYYIKGNQKYFLLLDEVGEPGDATVSAAMYITEAQKTARDDFDVVGSETNEIGRTTSVTIRIGEGEAAKDYTYELDCTSVEDEVAYEQAMRDYEYKQAKYEKAITDLNSKTADIQQKDKTLELELKQLDTEQNAIKTEMDAVSKVVENNIESTFKTFG